MMTVDSNEKLLSQFIRFRGEVQSARACLYPLSVDLGEVRLFVLFALLFLSLFYIKLFALVFLSGV
jgi:hypothetical protein